MKTLFSSVLIFALVAAMPESATGTTKVACRFALEENNAPETKSLERKDDARSFKLDRSTATDLGLIALSADVVGKHIVTELGQARLRELLLEPILDRQEIIDRQNAVKALIANPVLRAELRAFLTKMHKIGTDVFQKDDFPKIKEAHSKASRGAYYLASAASIGAFSAAAVFTYLDSKNANLLTPLSFIFMLGAPVSSPLIDQRQDIASLKPALDLAKKSQEGLRGAGASKLVELADALSAAHEPSHPDTFARTSQAIRRMAKGHLLSVLSQASFVGWAWTYELRAKVVGSEAQLAKFMTAIAELDLMAGLAELHAANPGVYTFPKILPEEQPTYLKIVQGHHPFVLAQIGKDSVANTIEMSNTPEGRSLSKEAPSFLLLTGPNTGGKSTYLKMVATNVILAQIGAPVPAQSMTLTPLSVLTNMNVQDALDKKQSFFYAQAKRVADVINIARTQKHPLLIMDEILNGTSPEEHTSAEQAIIKYLVREGFISILATHDRKLQKIEQEIPGVVNIHVDDKAKDTFTIKQGPSRTRNAMQVLREVGIEPAIVEDAEQYYRNMGIKD